MESVTFNVPAITCEHCVKNIARVVTDEVGGVAEVVGDHEAKQVTVRYAPPATVEQIIASMTEWDYPPAQ
jgi:copper chaperone CopZ